MEEQPSANELGMPPSKWNFRSWRGSYMIIVQSSANRQRSADPAPASARRKVFSENSRSFQAVSFIVADSITILKARK
jgi:hypothetical protein